jgi:hypothetical protein
METIRVEIEINCPSAWEIATLHKLKFDEVVTLDALYEGYTPQKAAWLNRLLLYGAICRSLPDEKGIVFYFITEFGKGIAKEVAKIQPG